MSNNLEPHRETISVVVPAHAAGPALSTTLRSLATLTSPPHEIIVVVDGGDPEIIDEINSYGFRSHPLSPRAGPAAARNAGAAISSGTILFFVDSDVQVYPDTIDKVRRAFSNREVKAIIGSYDDSPPSDSTVSWFRNILHHYTHQHGPDRVSSFWSGCGAIRREIFNEVGGFDATFDLPTIEDIEMGYRLRQLGIGVSIKRDLVVKHLKRWTLTQMIATDTFKRAKPWVQVMRRMHYYPAELNVSLRGRLSLVLTALMVCSLLGSIVSIKYIPVFIVFGLAFSVLNREFYALMLNKGGLYKACAGVFLHWVHLICAIVGALIGFATSLLESAKSH